MTPAQLRASFLQAAIQGRLVPQDPADGDAADLLAAIRAERARPVKEKRLRAPKPLPPITPDEIPFPIPSSWQWVRLGEIAQHNTGKALNAADKEGSLLTYITTSNIYWDRVLTDSLKSMYFTEDELPKCTVKKGDLLVCEGGDVGRAAIWPYEEEVRIQNHIHRIRPYCSVSTLFLYYIFYLYKLAGRIGGKGIAIPSLSTQAMARLPIPLPPLAEQERIVAKLEELLPLCTAQG